MNHPVPRIGVDDLAGVLRTGAPLIDVREPDEFETARIPGAVLIPLQSVPESLDAFPREGAVYIVCHSGGRSLRAATWLREQGIDAVNVDGGTSAWVESGQPYDSGRPDTGPSQG
jgi:rhodanese-related sulfurtransferase